MIRMTGTSTAKPPVRLSEKRHVSIEQLLEWVYADQLAHKIVGRGVGMHELERVAAGLEIAHVSGDGTWRIYLNKTLGCTIDGGGMGSGDLHPDAELVHEAVQSIEGSWPGLVIAHANLRAAPDWMPGAKPKVQARLRDNGKPMRVYDENDNVIGTQIEYVMLQENIDFARRIYWLWWQAVGKVLMRLESRATMLTSFVVTGQASPEFPWRDEMVAQHLEQIRFARKPAKSRSERKVLTRATG